MLSECSHVSESSSPLHDLLVCRTWAARCNTWLLIQLTPKGVVFLFFSFLFFSFLFFSFLFCSFSPFFSPVGLQISLAAGTPLTLWLMQNSLLLSATYRALCSRAGKSSVSYQQCFLISPLLVHQLLALDGVLWLLIQVGCQLCMICFLLPGADCHVITLLTEAVSPTGVRGEQAFPDSCSWP